MRGSPRADCASEARFTNAAKRLPHARLLARGRRSSSGGTSRTSCRPAPFSSSSIGSSSAPSSRALSVAAASVVSPGRSANSEKSIASRPTWEPFARLLSSSRSRAFSLDRTARSSAAVQFDCAASIATCRSPDGTRRRAARYAASVFETITRDGSAGNETRMRSSRRSDAGRSARIASIARSSASRRCCLAFRQRSMSSRQRATISSRFRRASFSSIAAPSFGRTPPKTSSKPFAAATRSCRADSHTSRTRPGRARSRSATIAVTAARRSAGMSRCETIACRSPRTPVAAWNGMLDAMRSTSRRPAAIVRSAGGSKASAEGRTAATFAKSSRSSAAARSTSAPCSRSSRRTSVSLGAFESVKSASTSRSHSSVRESRIVA